MESLLWFLPLRISHNNLHNDPWTWSSSLDHNFTPSLFFSQYISLQYRQNNIIIQKQHSETIKLNHHFWNIQLNFHYTSYW